MPWLRTWNDAGAGPGRTGALTLDVVIAHFRPQLEAGRLNIDRICERVSDYFRLSPAELQSRRRFRGVMLPRQVSMYLARQLTGLSFESIGAFFGGRDHTTVLHACRKVEEALQSDAALSGALKHLHAQLT